MWCSSCRADVAAELSTDNRRMLCARCQMELGVAAIETPRVAIAPRTVEAERDARELLARWSAQNLDAPPPASTNPISKPNQSLNTADLADARGNVKLDPPIGSAVTPRSPLRPPFPEQMDSPSPVKTQQSLTSMPGPSLSPESIDARRKKHTSPTREPSPPMTNPQIDGDVRGDDPRLAHDRVVLDALQRQLNRGSNWATLAGQLCAYGGVALLTCGTVLVMWSYFGGPANYMPTGWLTAAVGQMLLFLGVVTLISSGMEQTIHEVSWRIDSLADEVSRMSQSLEQFEQDEHPSRRLRSAPTRSRSKEDRRREVA